MSKAKKERLDKLLVDKGLVATRAKAKGLIMAGEVMVDGVQVDKAGTAVSPHSCHPPHEPNTPA